MDEVDKNESNELPTEVAEEQFGTVVSPQDVFIVPEATRFEIYPAEGRPAHVFTVAPGASIHIQDGGRTVKIFTEASTDAGAWIKARQRDSGNTDEEIGE